MKKKLLGNIILLLFINLLVKPYWILGIDRTFQNQFGDDLYGLYINLLSVSMILTMILDFGINNYNSSIIAQEPSKLNHQFSSLISLKILLSLVYMVFTMLLAWLYGYSGYMLLLVAVLGMNQVLAYFSTFVRSCITGLQYFRTDALLSSADRFVMILLGLLTLGGMVFSVSLESFILIQTIGYLVVLITGLLILRPHLSRFNLQFDWPLLRSLLIKTAPYALLAFIMLLYTQSGYLMMKKMLINGDNANGVYAKGGRLLDAANMMIGATSVIMLPSFARMIASREDLTRISELLSTVLLLPCITFSAFCCWYSNDIMHYLSPDASAYTADVFRVLIICFIPYGFMYTYGSMLTAKAEMRILNLICGVALVVNIGFNIYMIPAFGAWGAAFTALITQLVVGFGKFIFAIKKLHLRHSPAYYFKTLGFIPVAFASAWFLMQSGIQMVIGALLLAALLISWILLLRMLDWRTQLANLRQNMQSFKR